MLYETRHPKQVAKDLLAEGCTIEDYEVVQNRRKERLKRWQEHKVQVLLDKEMELITYGEEVLKHLREIH